MFFFELVPLIGGSTSILACFFLTFVYVAVLYFPNPSLKRNDAHILRMRLINVTLLSLLGPLFVMFFLDISAEDFLETFGLRVCGIQNAIMLPVLLTMILFLGPLLSINFTNFQYNLQGFKLYIKEVYLYWIRSYVLGPVSEEVIFRACMMSILLKQFSPASSITISSLFFGFAHSHLIFSRKEYGMTWKTAIQVSVLQITFASLFGAYSNYIFLQTRHLISSISVHVFCNIMGFPALDVFFSETSFKKYFLIGCHFLGVFCWHYFFRLLTNPALYCNERCVIV